MSISEFLRLRWYVSTLNCKLALKLEKEQQSNVTFIVRVMLVVKGAVCKLVDC